MARVAVITSTELAGRYMSIIGKTDSLNRLPVILLGDRLLTTAQIYYDFVSTYEGVTDFTYLLILLP